MDYVHLGKSGLKVSRIGLGTNNFGGQISEEDSIKIVRKALDLGINLIDTADVYTKGKSEAIIGKAVQGYRDQVVIASKVGMNMGTGPNDGGLSRKHIMRQIRRSLESLGTDHIDIYYLHCFDPETPLEETLTTLDGLVRQGMVRYVACSNFEAWQIAEANEVCSLHDLDRFVAVQPPYNLLQRNIEKDLLPYCQREKLGVITYTPLMGGLLTGKYMKDKSPQPGTRASYNTNYWNRVNKTEYFDYLDEIQKVAQEMNVSMSQLAVAWILRNPVVTAPLIGASSTEQVEENCRILEVKITDEAYAKLNEITETCEAELY